MQTQSIVSCSVALFFIRFISLTISFVMGCIWFSAFAQGRLKDSKLPLLVFDSLPPNSQSVKYIEETPQKPDLPSQRNPLFMECGYCSPDRLEWYASIDELKHMAYVCGYDYIIARFDRLYEDDNCRVTATYFFSIRDSISRLDSAYSTLKNKKNNSNIHFQVLNPTNQHIRTTARIRNQRADEDFFQYLETIVSQFHSSFIYRKTNDRDTIKPLLSLQFASNRYAINSQGIVCIPDTGIFNAKNNEQSSQQGVFKLGFDMNFAQKDTSLTSLSISEVQITSAFPSHVCVSGTVTSGHPLQKLRFRARSFDTTLLLPSENSIHFTHNCYIKSVIDTIVITVTNQADHRATVSIPTGHKKLALENQLKQHRARNEIVRQWSNRSLINKISSAVALLDPASTKWIRSQAIQEFEQGSMHASLSPVSLESIEEKTRTNDHYFTKPFPLTTTYSLSIPVMKAKDQPVHFTLDLCNKSQTCTLLRTTFSVTPTSETKPFTQWQLDTRPCVAPIQTPSDPLRFMVCDSIYFDAYGETIFGFPTPVRHTTPGKFSTLCILDNNVSQTPNAYFLDTLLFKHVVYLGKKQPSIFVIRKPVNMWSRAIVSDIEFLGLEGSRKDTMTFRSNYLLLASLYQVTNTSNSTQIPMRIDVFVFSTSRNRWVGAGSSVWN